MVREKKSLKRKRKRKRKVGNLGISF